MRIICFTNIDCLERIVNFLQLPEAPIKGDYIQVFSNGKIDVNLEVHGRAWKNGSLYLELHLPRNRVDWTISSFTEWFERNR